MSADADRIGVATANLWADLTREIQDLSPRPVGFGGYSDIYTAIWRSEYGDMKVAIKVIRAAPTPFKLAELPRALRREISVWKRLVHPNIHILCGFYEGFGSAPALVSPWYENGDINEYIRQRRAEPDIGLLKLKLFADVTTGLQFLHDNQIVHGDIKGGNVLISNNGVARLCDFGLSRLLLEHSQPTTNTGGTGTSRWMAPELHLVEGARPSYASDIWAFGCLIIEVWSSVKPYHTKTNDRQLMLALWQQEPPTRPSEMPDIIWAIVQECCTFDVASRPPPLRVGAYINRHLTMQRVHPMVIRGHPIDPEESRILRKIDASLQAADTQCLAGLCTLADAELATEVVRLFGLWSLSSERFDGEVFRWCLNKLGSGNHQAAGVCILPTTYTHASHEPHEPAKLRPLARLLERACPGLAQDFMTHFASSALRSPLQLHTEVRSVVWLLDGMRVVVGCHDGDVRILDVATGVTLLRLVGHTGEVNQVALSPNGKLLASCSEDRSIRLWDAETGLAISTPMFGHTHWVLSVAFAPDRRHIISGSRDDTIRLWSTEICRTVLGPLRGHAACVVSVAYSPNGSRIVSGSWDKTIRVWDARTGNPILTLCGHSDWIQSVAYSPDGLRVVTSSDDRTVRIWDASTGQVVGSLLEGHSGLVRSVAYSPDGTRIASGSHDNTIHIWNAATGAFIAATRGDWRVPYLLVYSLAFSPDGKRLASASHDGTVRIWDATEDWRRWDI